MGLQLEDGTGSGQLVEVSDNRLRAMAVNVSLTNHISLEQANQTVFTAIGTATVVSGTTVLLHIINNDPSNLLVIDRVVVQAAGLGGTLPLSGTYFSLGYNRTVTSGGTAITPVNLNRTATKIANVTATSSNPNMTGTFVESHRWLVQANGVAFELITPASNDIILGRSNTVEVQLNSNTSGNILTIFKFFIYSTYGIIFHFNINKRII